MTAVSKVFSPQPCLFALFIYLFCYSQPEQTKLCKPLHSTMKQGDDFKFSCSFYLPSTWGHVITASSAPRFTSLTLELQTHISDQFSTLPRTRWFTESFIILEKACLLEAPHSQIYIQNIWNLLRLSSWNCSEEYTIEPWQHPRRKFKKRSVNPNAVLPDLLRT